MNKATRLLAMTGMAVAAALTMGAGPASASTATAAKDHGGHDRVVGYFHSRLQCERSGRFGEMRDRWDRHDCNLVRFGRHHGDWQLSVSSHRGPFGHDRPTHRPPFHH